MSDHLEEPGKPERRFGFAASYLALVVVPIVALIVLLRVGTLTAPAIHGIAWHSERPAPSHPTEVHGLVLAGTGRYAFQVIVHR